MLVTEIKMLCHHLSSVCAILKYHMKAWNIFSTFVQLSSHQVIHLELLCPYTTGRVVSSRVRTCLRFLLKWLHSLVYFSCGYHMLLPVCCFTWLWEQMGFPFPKPPWDSLKSLIFHAEVIQLWMWWHWGLEGKQSKSQAEECASCKWDFLVVRRG